MRKRLLLLGASASALASFAQANETITYTYDVQGRLQNVAHSGTVNNGVNTAYSYDKADNRLTKTTTGAGPVFSVNSQTATEGSAITFTVTKSGSASGTTSVNYATADGTATAGSDYTAASGPLTFLVGDTSKTVTVQTTDDTAVESPETFSLVLSGNSAGTSIGTGTGTGTINDNDVGFAIGNATVTEGGTATFTVTKTGTASGTLTVDYATSDGTATAGQDYTSTPGTLTFLPGDTTKTISVPTNDDGNLEAPETFTVTLSNNSAGSTLTNATGTGTINDNDSTSYAISAGPSVVEGNPLTFTITRSGTLSSSVNYATSDGTATAGSDYTATSGTISFGPGEISKTVTVPTTDDTTSETDETLAITLSSPTNGATIATPSATGTITDNEVPPTTVNVGDVESFEGTNMVFTITRSGPGKAFTVNYATSNGTAASGSDYTSNSGSVSFSATDVSKTVSIFTNNDSTIEPDETVNLTLSSPTNGVTINDGSALGRILNDDDSGNVNDRYYVADYTVTEGNSIQVTIVRDPGGGGGGNAGVNYSTSSGTATSGTDFTAKSGFLGFNGTNTQATITINTTQDALVEGNETFNINLTPQNSQDAISGATPEGVITIKDDD